METEKFSIELSSVLLTEVLGALKKLKTKAGKREALNRWKVFSLQFNKIDNEHFVLVATDGKQALFSEHISGNLLYEFCLDIPDAVALQIKNWAGNIGIVLENHIAKICIGDATIPIKANDAATFKSLGVFDVTRWEETTTFIPYCEGEKLAMCQKWVGGDGKVDVFLMKVEENKHLCPILFKNVNNRVAILMPLRINKGKKLN